MIEDVHWADRSTRDLVAFLVRNLRGECVLLIVSYRSDEPQTARLEPWLAELDRGPVQRLELPRFQRAELVAQLTGILRVAPDDDLVDAVFARSQGNPFFTEELLEAVRVGSRVLPASLRDLLRGRIQILSAPAQQLLKVAAAAGRPVSHRLLAAVTELSDEQLTAVLREAVAAKLLVTRPDNDGYDLRHALLREVIDADLLPGEQMSLHATYAQVLAGRPELADASSAVAAAELAAHWQAAGHPVHALPALVVAGRTAEQATAFPEAYRHYQQGLTLWDQVPNPEQLAAWVDLRRVGTPPPKVMRLRAASASNAPWGPFWPPTWPATCSRPAAGRTPIACSARCWMMRRRRPSASTMWQGSSKPLEGTSPPPGSI